MNKHFDYLDSVRGIACMIVLVVHFTETLYPGICFGTCKIESINYYNILYYTPLGIIISGHSAVCLFFILSGFVLSYRFIGDCEIVKIAECIFKRPIRLYGMVYFSMIVVFIFSNMIDRMNDNWDGVLMQLIFRPVQVNGVLWTIKIEFLGSIGTFLFCGITSNLSFKIRMMILFILLIMFKDTFYVAFVFGVLIADLYRNYSSEWFIKNKNLMSWIILIPAIMFFSYPYHLASAQKYLQNVLFIEGGYAMIGAMLMFIFIMTNDKFKSVLNFKPLVFIGGISYSIYILHNLLIKYSHDSLFGYIGKYISTNHLVVYFVGMIIIFILTIIISYIVDKYVDKPCIKFSTRFAKWLVAEIKKLFTLKPVL